MLKLKAVLNDICTVAGRFGYLDAEAFVNKTGTNGSLDDWSKIPPKYEETYKAMVPQKMLVAMYHDIEEVVAKVDWDKTMPDPRMVETLVEIKGYLIGANAKIAKLVAKILTTAPADDEPVKSASSGQDHEWYQKFTIPDKTTKKPRRSTPKKETE